MITCIDLSENWSFFSDKEEKLSAPPEHFQEAISFPAVSSGCIWIQKEIVIPSALQGKKIELFLERAVFTKIWVNQNYLASYCNAYIPHSYDISEYANAERICLTICMKNDLLAGKIFLRFYAKNHIRNVRFSVNCQKQQAECQFLTGGSFRKVSVQGEWFDRNGTIALISPQMLEIQHSDKHYASGIISFKEKFLLWDIHHPVMCKLLFTPELSKDQIEITFGMTDSNTEKPFLRGGVCPLPSPLTSEEEWLPLLKTVKSYGINLLSFQGCPPEIAFQTADLLGIFLAPMLSPAELKQVSATFGNHPSFMDFSTIELHKMNTCQTYPDLKEFPVAESLKQHNLLDLAEEFKICSGQYAIQLYKKEIETVLCSEHLKGFKELPLQDGEFQSFSGILNSRLESKKMISKKAWTGFCSDSVLLGEFDSEILTDKLNMKILLRHHSPVPVFEPVEYVVESGNTILAEGEIPVHIQNQGLFEIGRLSLSLKPANHVHKMKVTLSLSHTENCYGLWQFPAVSMPELESSESLCITSNKTEMLFMLRQGRNVLYFPEYLKNTVPLSETLGLQIHKHHQALGLFRCERWATPQWFEILAHADCLILDELKTQPIVQVIDDFKRNHKLGILFECSVGKGKLLVCTSHLQEIADKPEVCLFAKSIIIYASSEAFCPKETLTFRQIEEIL